MNQKLIFLDVDGTIYDEDKNIPGRALYTIQQLKENGHIVAIASGRAPFTLQHVLHDTGIESFVAFNGQYVWHDGQVIDTKPLSHTALVQLEKQAAANNHPMVFFTHEDVVSNVDFHHHIHDSLASIKLEHPRFADNFNDGREIFQALIFQEAIDDSLYDGQYDELKFYRWHELSRDVVPADGSKASGMMHLARALGFSQHDCIAVGDGNNDFEMIVWAGTGIAMGNAVPDLKEIADVVTLHVAQDGLYHAFRELGMIEEEVDE